MASGILFLPLPLPRAGAPVFARFPLSNGMGCAIRLRVRQDRHGEGLS
jgi:hypothetical protein